MTTALAAAAAPRAKVDRDATELAVQRERDYQAGLQVLPNSLRAELLKINGENGETLLIDEAESWKRALDWRIARYLKPQTILETHVGLRVGTRVFEDAAPQAKIYSCAKYEYDLARVPDGAVDLVDIDPSGRPDEALEMALRTFAKNAVLMITSGGMMEISRGWVLAAPDGRLYKKDAAPPDARFYTGRDAIKWVDEIYLPAIAKQTGMTVQFRYCFPTTVRVVLSRQPLPRKLFDGCPPLMWWLREPKPRDAAAQAKVSDRHYRAAVLHDEQHGGTTARYAPSFCARAQDEDNEFPKTIAAAQALHKADERLYKAERSRWSCQWALGDALIAECGPPGDSGVRTGSDDKLRAAAKVLKKLGLPGYSFDHLRDLRRTADAFLAGDRSPAVSWTVHSVASDKETLDAAIAAAKESEEELTVAFVKEFKKRQRPGPKHRGDKDASARVTALENLRSAAADAIEAAKVGQKRIATHIAEWTTAERQQMIAAVSQVEQAWAALRTSLEIEPSELHEAAE
jgi:hypothetical protein